MKTMKQLLATATIASLTAGVPSIGLAQPMMGPGMGYGYIGPGMMGDYCTEPWITGRYGVSPGMMGGYGARPGMMGRFGVGPGMMGPGIMEGPYGGVDLTDEQNAKIAAIQEEFSRKQSDLTNQMQGEQFKLQQLYFAPKRDNAAVNEQFSKINQLRRQMWDVTANAQKKTQDILTNDQRNAMRRWGGPHMMWGW